MAISYKTLWQEARQENAKLQTKIDNLRRDIDEMAAAITNGRTEQGPTRQIVDLAGIARHMRVKRWTPQQWQQRGLLPPVDFPEIKEPLWFVTTIKEQFVIPTRRVWHDNPSDAVEPLSPAA